MSQHSFSKLLARIIWNAQEGQRCDYLYHQQQCDNCYDQHLKKTVKYEAVRLNHQHTRAPALVLSSIMHICLTSTQPETYWCSLSSSIIFTCVPAAQVSLCPIQNVNYFVFFIFQTIELFLPPLLQTYAISVSSFSIYLHEDFVSAFSKQNVFHLPHFVIIIVLSFHCIA